MRGLCNKVSDPLKVRHRLACIAEDTILTHIQIFMCNTGNKIVICQLQLKKNETKLRKTEKTWKKVITPMKVTSVKLRYQI